MREVKEKPDTGGTYYCASLPDDYVALEDGSDSDVRDTGVSESESKSKDESKSKSKSKGKGASEEERV